jgi:hypothetical protein
MKEISALFVYILAVISFTVTIGIARKRSMWGWILAYWIVLTIKNYVDWWGVSW